MKKQNTSTMVSPLNATINSTTAPTIWNSRLSPLSCLTLTTYTVITSITAPMTFLGVCMYIGVLVAFFRRRSLITHFTVHILSLSVINIIHGLGYWPQAAARPFTDQWLKAPFVCAIFQYFIWITPIMTIMQDLVICGDRWVAFLAPVWYHSHRSIQSALCGTVIVIVWSHGWVIPLNILNYITPMALRQGCDGTAYPVYRTIVFAMIGYVPEVLVYGSYPILLALLWQRQRAKRQLRRARMECIALGSTNSIPMSTRLTTAGVEAANNEAGRRQAIAKTERANNRLATALILLKFVASVFMTIPTVLFNVAATNRRLPAPCTWDIYHFGAHILAVVLFVEPFIYLMSMKDLRNEFLLMFQST
ncbi:hypothetical protein BV898_02161 [Hypsibius exemplaris]|uniref:G-protein coupled receptors family 1 profile domain-containing protein n=1 Tax=Hypsibius exemplaris TaxID=2072580 RepID=A0A1W0X8F7_HYPEX|nr:hypothetical protein BV898_02161 [Hypsibius exemplaris]